MMKKIRKFAALVLTLCVLASLAAPALAASGVQSELQGSAAYMLSAVKAPEVGSIGGEWAVIGLARSGYPVPANYLTITTRASRSTSKTAPACCTSGNTPNIPASSSP